MQVGDGTVTRLLERSAQGDPEARSELLRELYDELRRIAKLHLRDQRNFDSLQPTSLVHDAYLKLFGQPADDTGDASRMYTDRQHFFRVASSAMRQVVIDYHRSRHRQKREGTRVGIGLEQIAAEFDAKRVDAVEFQDALDRFRTLDAEAARVVELHYHLRLPITEVAKLVGRPLRSVERDWQSARAWLRARFG
jgi:RNA polymerase sigma factor (TIGR02999 family)